MTKEKIKEEEFTNKLLLSSFDMSKAVDRIMDRVAQAIFDDLKKVKTERIITIQEVEIPSVIIPRSVWEKIERGWLDK